MSLPVTSDSPPVTSTLRVSVVIPTHNPRADYLTRVIEALREQTLEQSAWELVVVDNGSRVPLKAGAVKGGKVGRCESGSAYAIAAASDSRLHSATAAQAGVTGGDLTLTNLKHNTPELELGWHPNARIVREEELGLTFARLRGFAEAKGDLIVMVDDDNVLAPDYLETAIKIVREHPMLGAFGGKCLPEFEVEPEGWVASVTSGLGLRDRGDRQEFFPEAAVAEGGKVGRLEGWKVKRAVREFPDCAPIGAGMVLRREAARAYAERLCRRSGLRVAGGESDGVSVAQAEQSPNYCPTETPSHRAASVITDRRGDSLASGGDNDICLTVVEEGWQVGYLPQLQLTHLIPEKRMTLAYQKRMAREAMRSFILMLDQHGIRPWSAVPGWSVPLRVARDYLRVQPWRSPERLLKWCMNRGRYEACGSLAASGRAAD